MGFRENFAGSPERAYGAHLADRFWLKEQRSHVTDTFKRGVLAVTHVRSDSPTPRPTQNIVHDDAYLVALQLREVLDHELWEGARPVKVDAFGENSTNFYDLRRDPVAFVRQPFHSLQFYMPRTVLNEIAQQDGFRFHGELTCPCGASREDLVMRHIGEALVPALEHGGSIDGLFLDHILQAVALHVIGTYGDARRTSGRAQGGLAGWQERRAKEMMRASLDVDISLQDLADACGLSVSHFTRAFRQSAKTSPHRWLRDRRLEKAIELLACSGQSLSDIAATCGFADQSHFTRIFAQHTGTSPGKWRRQNR